MLSNVKAQHGAPRKQITRCYGANEGICLFENVIFMPYGYAISVFGRFKSANDQQLFFADKAPMFEVYASHNKGLQAETHINF